MHRRQSHTKREGVYSNPVGAYERVGNDVECIRAALKRLEGGRDILRSPDFECGDLKAERAGRRCLNLVHFKHGGGIAHIGHNGQPAQAGESFAQKLKALARKISPLEWP